MEIKFTGTPNEIEKLFNAIAGNIEQSQLMCQKINKILDILRDINLIIHHPHMMTILTSKKNNTNSSWIDLLSAFIKCANYKTV